MSRFNLTRVGFGIALLEPTTNNPIMIWNKRLKSFDGLLTIDSLFEEEKETQKHEQINNPYISCKVVKIEYTCVNGSISIKVL